MSVQVVAITVTYGERWIYLRQVLERLVGERSVLQIIVIDNASTTDVGREVVLCGMAGRVHVERQASNLGSAAAFARALTLARDVPEATHAYLLDDDNLPEVGAVDALARRAAVSGPEVSLVSWRPSRAEQVALVERGIPVKLHRNAFLSFSVWQTLKARLAAITGKSHRKGQDSSLEYAPYGGFFLALERLSDLGLPKAEFFLYADDHEFTYRFSRKGGSIQLCMDSTIHDLEPSWGTRKQAGLSPFFDPAAPKARVYYSVRNRVAFEKEQLVSSATVYWFNAAVTFGVKATSARMSGVPSRELLVRSRLLGQAVRDGWTGRLGRTRALQ